MAARQMRQHEGNLGIMTSAEQARIARLRVMLVGLGGLGGQLANSFARLGIRTMTLVDFDRFDAANLNRQLFSSPATIGRYKTDVVDDELRKLDPEFALSVRRMRVEELAASEFDAVDVVVDAVDDIKTKLFLETTASAHGKPLLHGAVGGWYGQVGILTPGGHLLGDLYRDAPRGIEADLGSPTFTPAVVANMMVGELVKFVLGRPHALIDRIMMIDLYNHDYRIVGSRVPPDAA